MDNSDESLELAVEMIRQLENLDYSQETILQAMVYVCRDTLNKLDNDSKSQWQQKLVQALQQ